MFVFYCAFYPLWIQFILYNIFISTVHLLVYFSPLPTYLFTLINLLSFLYFLALLPSSYYLWPLLTFSFYFSSYHFIIFFFCPLIYPTNCFYFHIILPLALTFFIPSNFILLSSHYVPLPLLFISYMKIIKTVINN